MSLIDQLIDGANAVYADSKILRDLCILQGIHESNLLNTPSKLASLYFNLFGIKKEGTAGIIQLKTWEVINGVKVTVTASFGRNKTVLDSCRQHRQVLSLPRYHQVWEVKSLPEACLAVVRGGYCTDPNYSQKLMKIKEQIKSRLGE